VNSRYSRIKNISFSWNVEQLMHEDDSTYPFWIEEMSGGRARIGLSETYLETLGGEEIVGVELQPVGMRLGPGDGLGFLFTGTRAIDLRAPLACEILAHNELIKNDARLIRLSPYHRGWLMEIRP
jgi:glycine cleavage system H lipoate-binding protein